MCFRPAETGKTITCQACGKTMNEVPGFALKDCMFCKAPLVRDGEGLQASAQPTAPAAAPGAPTAPGAPKPPAPTA